jgi:hypothetical protein
MRHSAADNSIFCHHAVDVHSLTGLWRARKHVQMLARFGITNPPERPAHGGCACQKGMEGRRPAVPSGRASGPRASSRA